MLKLLDTGQIFKSDFSSLVVNQKTLNAGNDHITISEVNRGRIF